MSTKTNLKIAIIGAGPAGCVLARILTQSNVATSISLTIFEGEASLNVRSQGGTLDLHPGAGLDAIKSANLTHEFEQYARYDGESLILSDKHLFKFLQMKGDPNAKSGMAPEIDRFRLRQLLLDSLPHGIVQWSKRLAEVTEDGQGLYSLHFRDGTMASDFDLVVGADGAWSKVRPVLSDAKPLPAGVSNHTFTISNASVVAPETVKLLNGGNVFSQHDHKFVAQQRMGDDAMQFAVSWAVEGDEQTEAENGTTFSDLESAKRFILDEKLADWDPLLRKALENCSAENTHYASWDLVELPIGHHWDHKKGATLIGDAAHVMTPYAGEGVNQALTDASVLAKEMVKAISASKDQGSEALKTALDSAVQAYEKEMFPRMKTKMTTTHNMKTMNFHTDGGMSQNVDKWILTAAADHLPLPALTMPILGAGLYAYFAFIRAWYKPKP